MKAGATSPTGTPSSNPDAAVGVPGRAQAPRAFLGLAVAALLAGALGFGAAAPAQDVGFFRIGTGGVAGTYYPIGGLIAAIISHPPGARPCNRGGSCGVPGLIAVVQSSHGSVANVRAIQAGELESGFVQSDVAHWAYRGTGVFAGEEPMDGLRAIAGLYPESVHLVAHPDAGIASVRDLAGRRVSLDEFGSGTLVNARIILGAFGLTEADLDEAFYLKPSDALGMIHAGELDAFFITAGYPTLSVTELADAGHAELVPIDGPEAEALSGYYNFLEPDVIPAGTYAGIGDTETLSVEALWLVGANVDEDLVYGVTGALLHPSAREVLDQGHAKGQRITLETALKGISVPLHPGAERYYREKGVLPEPATADAADAAEPPAELTPAVQPESPGNR